MMINKLVINSHKQDFLLLHRDSDVSNDVFERNDREASEETTEKYNFALS